MVQKQLQGFIESLADQYNCDEKVIEVIETFAQELTGQQVADVIKNLAERDIVVPVEIQRPEWQRQVLLNRQGAVIINNTGRAIASSADLFEVKDYAHLVGLCNELGFEHSSITNTRMLESEATRTEAIVYELTFRTDGYYLLQGHVWVHSNFADLAERLSQFDPQNNTLLTKDDGTS